MTEPKRRAMIVPPSMDHDPVEVTPENGTDFTLDEMQAAVGGNIEVVPIPKEGLCGGVYANAIVNEEGFLLNMETNGFISVVLGRPIVGSVLLILDGQIK